MTEPSKENRVSNSPHEQFISERGSRNHQRALNIFGGTLVGLGVIFAIDGISQFISGQGISHHLAQVDGALIPQFATKLAENLSSMPLVLKTAGASAMITTGAWLSSRT